MLSKESPLLLLICQKQEHKRSLSTEKNTKRSRNRSTEWGLGAKWPQQLSPTWSGAPPGPPSHFLKQQDFQPMRTHIAWQVVRDSHPEFEVPVGRRYLNVGCPADQHPPPPGLSPSGSLKLQIRRASLPGCASRPASFFSKMS